MSSTYTSKRKFIRHNESLDPGNTVVSFHASKELTLRTTYHVYAVQLMEPIGMHYCQWGYDES